MSKADETHECPECDRTFDSKIAIGVHKSRTHRDDPTRLRECPVCGAIGLRERIADHDCQAFLERRGEDR